MTIDSEPQPDLQAYDELYKDIKRGDLVLYWFNVDRHCWAVVVEVHDVRTLTLTLVAGTVEEAFKRREAVLQAATSDPTNLLVRVPRFDRHTHEQSGTWSGTWCEVH